VPKTVTKRSREDGNNDHCEDDNDADIMQTANEGFSCNVAVRTD
jgi:hypothetical protein